MNMRHWIAGCAAAVMLVSVLPAAAFVRAANVQRTTRTAVARSPHVYLLRGFLNVFSLGMDTLGQKIERRGIHVTVANHLAWGGLADEAIDNCKRGRQGAIILIGHSAGATAAIDMAEKLGQAGVTVSLVVTFDPVFRSVVPGNVRRAVNFYFSNGVGTPLAPGPMFRGSLRNIDMKGRSDLGHTSLGGAADIHAQVVGYVLAARNSTCHR